MHRPKSIEVDRLSFGYEGRAVLKNVTLSLQGDLCYAIIGPNGGGKTTFLQLMMGFLSPDQGTILIDGKTPQAIREWIGYVPQTPYFDKQFPLSVEELVLMGALHELGPFGRWKKETKEKAKRALELVNLSHKAKDAIGELSGGQIQRAYIARAIMNHPKILFLDEPTASLDPQVAKEIIDLLKELKKEISIFVVSHDLDGIAAVADRAICIQKEVNLIDIKELCHHFSLGVYHQLTKRSP